MEKQSEAHWLYYTPHNLSHKLIPMFGKIYTLYKDIENYKFNP